MPPQYAVIKGSRPRQDDAPITQQLQQEVEERARLTAERVEEASKEIAKLREQLMASATRA